MCERPLTAYRPANGGPLLWKPNPTVATSEIQLPCGNCILCRTKHSKEWAIRITHESQLHDENSFVTLTYADEHLPLINNTPTLRLSDLQKFIKRLRFTLDAEHGKKIRYYAVGEYGSKSNRPHYHLCVFGHAFTERRTILRREPSLLWTNDTLEKTWGMGEVRVGALTFATAQYTASYVTKKLRAKQQYVYIDKETGELKPLEQPKAVMSLKPAIGLEWWLQHHKQTTRNDYVIMNGSKHKPPKYYDTLLKRLCEEEYEGMKEKRTERLDKVNALAKARARAGDARARAEAKKHQI